MSSDKAFRFDAITFYVVATIPDNEGSEQKDGSVCQKCAHSAQALIHTCIEQRVNTVACCSVQPIINLHEVVILVVTHTKCDI